MYQCVQHLRVCDGKWVTAMDTVLKCVVLLTCNCGVMRVSPVCDYTEMGEISVWVVFVYGLMLVVAHVVCEVHPCMEKIAEPWTEQSRAATRQLQSDPSCDFVQDE